MSFKVTGRVTVLETGIPVPTLRVRVWDRDLVFDDDLGEVKTGPDGSFEHQFEREDFDDFGVEPFPDLYLVITTVGGRVLVDTSDNTRYNASENEHFDITIPSEQIGEEDGALCWAIRPRVTGTLTVHDGETSVPTYIGNVAEAFSDLLIELWDPKSGTCLAVDEPSSLQFNLWYWIGSFPSVRELELRVKRGAEGTEIFRSRRFGVSLDTQVKDIDLQRRVLLGAAEDPVAVFSHTRVAEGVRIAREPSDVISVAPAPPRETTPAPSALNPRVSLVLPEPPDNADLTVDDDDEDSPPEPYRMILGARPMPVARASDPDAPPGAAEE
ncbi:MAG: hypothetical protein ACI8PZ_003481 [Myxococcota bacterium]|jgi:hypothetical protein